MTRQIVPQTYFEQGLTHRLLCDALSNCGAIRVSPSRAATSAPVGNLFDGGLFISDAAFARTPITVRQQI